jgi:hypothetical protein
MMIVDEYNFTTTLRYSQRKIATFRRIKTGQ